MPFTCNLSLNNGAVDETDIILFNSWVDSAWDNYISAGTKYAVVEFNNQKAFLVTTCECKLLQKSKLSKGDNINSTTVIGTFACDGEIIPHNKPYSKVEV